MNENIIPWVISALSLLFVILTYVRNGNKDKATELKEDDLMMNSIKESLLKVDMKLDQLCQSSVEMKADLKSLNKDFTALETRVAVVEKELKNAFHLIDELKQTT